MALLDEQIVEEWLNRKCYFTMRGIKSGLNEIDILAIKPVNKTIECLHVEVQIGFSKMGYLGERNTGIKTNKEIIKITEEWVSKKFFQPIITKKRNELIQNESWKYLFVYGLLKDELQLSVIKDMGIEIISYDEILTDLLKPKKTVSTSQATNILDIIKYSKSKKVI